MKKARLIGACLEECVQRGYSWEYRWYRLKEAITILFTKDVSMRSDLEENLKLLRTAKNAKDRNKAALALYEYRLPRVRDALIDALRSPLECGTILYVLRNFDCGEIIFLDLIDILIRGNFEEVSGAICILQDTNKKISLEVLEESYARLKNAVVREKWRTDEIKYWMDVIQEAIVWP